jgi:hypothetical protein
MMPKFPPTIQIGSALSIGEPFKIMTHYPTVVIQCQCEAKTVLSLVFAQTVQTCPACRMRYLITDQMEVGVGAMRPEGSEVVQ